MLWYFNFVLGETNTAMLQLSGVSFRFGKFYFCDQLPWDDLKALQMQRISNHAELIFLQTFPANSAHVWWNLGHLYQQNVATHLKERSPWCFVYYSSAYVCDGGGGGNKGMRRQKTRSESVPGWGKVLMCECWKWWVQTWVQTGGRWDADLYSATHQSPF